MRPAKLPAVSGSSGRLVVERGRPTPTPDRTWPGHIFANRAIPYHAAMEQFAHASRQRFEERKYQAPPRPTAPDPRRALRAEAAALRTRRRAVRARRQAEDQAWRALWTTRKHTLEVRRCAGGALAWTDDAEDRQWRFLRQHRYTTLRERQAEDTAWRVEQHALRQALSAEVLPPAWRAILIVTDNCTRQCYELPMFTRGGRVSAEEVIDRLEHLLPTDVEFVISDQGTHFMAAKFQELAKRCGFVHVPIARHRPESNGIAERCVRTLKAWLADKLWSSDAELRNLLAAFCHHYNDRPHQGLSIPGLSPNEFAHRIWLF